MPSRSRAAIAPAYLFACLILGGSVQGIWQNVVLQLAGVAIIAWAAAARREGRMAPAARQLLLLAILSIAVVALQLVPLPATVWSHLGPRAAVAQGFRSLGMEVPAAPLSLTPASGLDSLLRIIPPLALVCAMVRLRAYRPQWLAFALIAGTLAGICLGAMQVASSSGNVSPLYLYEQTNPGRGVGFFANADHMATLLVIAIPFLAAVAAAAKRSSMQRYSAVVAMTAGLAIVLFVGIALNGSLAGYGLALPVIAAGALIVLPASGRLRLWVVAVAAVLVLGSVTALETTSIGSPARHHVGPVARRHFCDDVACRCRFHAVWLRPRFVQKRLPPL
jgi:hypothetical protein